LLRELLFGLNDGLLDLVVSFNLDDDVLLSTIRLLFKKRKSA
jgi:hypothetical protein